MADAKEKRVLVELRKDWADMTPDEQDAVVKQLVEGMCGPGTFKAPPRDPSAPGS